MSFQWRCYLDDVELDTEPVGLADIELSIIRDDSLHGISGEASTSPMRFTGNGASYLENKKGTEGLKAEVIFKAQNKCGDQEDYTDVIVGKVNMIEYKKSCGTSCSISVPIEENSCEMILKNRYDQPVDMDKNVAFDGMTALPIYDDLRITESLPTRELPVKNEAYVLDSGDSFNMDLFLDQIDAQAFKLYLRPTFSNKIAENINQSEFEGTSNFAEIPSNSALETLSPVFLFDEVEKCFDGALFDYSVRLKGNADFNNPEQGFNAVKLVLAYGEFPDSLTVIDFANVPFTNSPDHLIGGFVNTDFDHTFTGTDFNLPNGIGLYAFFEIDYPNSSPTNVDPHGTIVFDSDTHFLISTTKQCPPTDTEAYMIHETLSHVTESITNGCARVKSSYYGRIDSQPFSFQADGCGGLRFLTSGLKIRNAANPTFFASLQDLIQGLQAIDNIGMGIEPADDLQGGYVLRIEDLDYFYRDQEIFRCEAINEGSYTLDASRFYSIIKIGYQKWETQANFGLDEYNSNRQYRTSLSSVSNTLDRISKLVAGEYAIEITREQQYVETNSADTTYDDDIFIVCLKRNGVYGYAYGGLIVEQGGIDSPLNIFSPDSTYNYRISPARNLMRWFRSIAPSYPNLTDSDNKIFFGSGVGNIIASGKLADNYIDTCDMEGVSIAENQDISIQMFKDQAKATPLWSNDIFTFDYPLSLSDYMKIKANPYGYISFQCGLGEFEKGYIKELKYKPVDGKANFILRKKWQS